MEGIGGILMMCLLRELEQNGEGILAEMPCGGLLSRRLKQFGMIPGTKVRYLGSAPMGSPLLFRVRGAVISLRKEDCAGITVLRA